jgi:uncharacterized membrane protein HdeD (DUF308 family)
MQRDAMNATLARYWWAIALRGVIAVLLGIAALAAPGAIILSLALLFGIYLLADGVLGLVATVRAVEHHRRWVTLLAEAVLNVLVGLVALFLPSAAVLGFVLLMAGWALVTGGLMIGTAIRMHHTHGRWWMGLGGLASVVWGLLLAMAPLVGAVVVAWWLGVYAIVFGVSLLISAWHLRARHVAV